ncbi:putative cell surface glycoprotein [Paratrimastix pyriformis]|uniref:Cell surface glycoprotein n=1 Tax=Paratrimastix pyriformis TaxID=342808 RepID=A0ABQ8UUL5_9EUKA|nr:putative cell surface glycoprotein [Paratrimastix pyriformis]
MEIPFWTQIKRCQRILLTGCGGGFDFTHALPLFFALRKLGKTCFLGNFAFSHIPEGEVVFSAPLREDIDDEQPILYKVTADTPILGNYFPERYLSLYFREVKGEEVPIYTFVHDCGAQSLRSGYERLCNLLELDGIVLVDGGSDSLMNPLPGLTPLAPLAPLAWCAQAGDEAGLGTPEEDMASLYALDQLRPERPLALRCLVCLGLGVDRFHDVSDVASLRAVAELTESGAFWGAHTLLGEMEGVAAYREAGAFIGARMPRQPSIVGALVADSIQGRFGNYHSNQMVICCSSGCVPLARTAHSKLFLNPLMSMYWFFDLPGVVRRLRYPGPEMAATRSLGDVSRLIRRTRQELVRARAIRPTEEYPRTGDF